MPAIVAEADLDGFRLSAANDFAAAPPGEKYLGAERFRVHLVGSVDPDGATHLTLSTIGGLYQFWGCIRPFPAWAQSTKCRG